MYNKIVKSVPRFIQKQNCKRCVYVCVCICVHAYERDREKKGEREEEREKRWKKNTFIDVAVIKQQIKNYFLYTKNLEKVKQMNLFL